MTHPYAELEDLDVWRVLDSEVARLEGNRDLEISTGRQYVIGALAKRLVDDGLVVARRPTAAAPAAPGGAAATAAVILRVAGALLLLPGILGTVLQLWLLTRGTSGPLTVTGGLAGIGLLLFYTVPGLLLIWFARPLGRFLARGL